MNNSLCMELVNSDLIVGPLENANYNIMMDIIQDYFFHTFKQP